jgi:MFS family permease
MFLLTLPAGEISDRFDQRKVLAAALVLEAVCSGLLVTLTFAQPGTARPFYAVMVLFGCARGFSGPAGQSLLPFLVPPERLTHAIAWGSSIFQIAVIAGPAIGGFLYALSPSAAYAVCLVGFLGAGIGIATLSGRRRPRDDAPMANRLERVKEGVRFVRSRPVVLGAISLDLFAVLLGGATALLPVFARDILHTGPIGLGVLRSGPAVGAALMALYLTREPVRRGTGRKMFAAVAIFGLATIVFGLSKNFYLSLGALAILGASDQISVFIRTALIQYATPDAMRGRVSAVNMLFIGASNELGEFESGVTAALFGTVPAVLIGGIGTLGVVALWMKAFPPLRKVNRLTDVQAR